VALGTLFVVGTPIGNLEDISPRVARILGAVALVAAEDTRSAARLYTHLGIRKPKVISFFEGNEAERSAELSAALERGDDVAVISEAGMPGVSDPGERAVRAAVDLGARVEVIPGPVAAISALVGSGLPTAPFLFIGFPPRDAGPRRQLFGRLRGQQATIVLYESPERAAACLADLAAGFGADRRVVLARELTKRHEEYVRGTASELATALAASPPRGECTIVVEGAAEGEAVEVDVEAELRALLDQGLGPKDAAQRLVVVTGKPRRQLYQLALSLQRERR
jgi:16S rRNA (cytidine1402-2'-O)-methyltransferase